MEESQKDKTAPGKKGSWTVSLAGISQATGRLVQISHTSEESLQEALEGFKLIDELFKKRNIEPIVPAFAEALGATLKEELASLSSQNLQTSSLSADPIEEMRTMKVESMKLMYTENGNAYLLCKCLPDLMRHGVFAWTEVYEPIIGKEDEVVKKFGVAKEIKPIPEGMQFALVFYKGKKPQKIIGFSSESKSTQK